ncbi:zinc finger protein 862-like [Diabrotica undecimpunctata]|uniref:zinc finger protein 862-like n=1 Tax=Diabrotica undecimpunctata TaxID=50387 RepID=UPI003B637088
MDRFVIRKRKISESDQTEVHASTSTSIQAEASTSTNTSTQNILDDLTENESPPTHEIKKNKKKTYVRKFRDSWLAPFSWLKLEPNGQKMCKVCNKSIEGSKTHLERHQQNSRHKQLLKQVTSTGNIENLLQNNEQHAFSTSVKKAEYKLVMGLVVEHNSPMLLMDHVPKLLASTVPDSKIIKSLACGRTKTTNMIHMLKREAESVLIAKLQVTKFSIIIDETTDISTRKCLAILVRYLDKTSYSVMDSLFTLVEVEECTADGLTSAILNVLNTLNINLQNVIGFAADNASVMMGEFGGVQAKLKEKINTNIFVIGCICHSLHLCASEASKKIPSCIEEFVQDVYNYISWSPKRLKVYSQFQKFLEIKPHKILKLSQTRWLLLEVSVVFQICKYHKLKHL